MPACSSWRLHVMLPKMQRRGSPVQELIHVAWVGVGKAVVLQGVQAALQQSGVLGLARLQGGRGGGGQTTVRESERAGGREEEAAGGGGRTWAPVRRWMRSPTRASRSPTSCAAKPDSALLKLLMFGAAAVPAASWALSGRAASG